MAIRYRKHKQRIEGEWHFHPDCLDWPEYRCIEKAIPPFDESLCSACVRLFNNDHNVESIHGAVIASHLVDLFSQRRR
jgi:hypothetical protein